MDSFQEDELGLKIILDWEYYVENYKEKKTLLKKYFNSNKIKNLIFRIKNLPKDIKGIICSKSEKTKLVSGPSLVIYNDSSGKKSFNYINVIY